MARQNVPFLERMWAMMSPEPFSGCWLWMGYITPQGYGRSSEAGGKSDFAHRIAYRALRGPIPAGLHLDHLCRVRCCINPAHLEPVTPAETIRRGETGIQEARKTHCPQGHEYTPENTRISCGSRICRACAKVHARKSEDKRKGVRKRWQ